MKLKIATLVATALAGAGASVALADKGRGDDDGKQSSAKCQNVHVKGTLAAQALSVAVSRANKAGLAAGSTASFAIPAGARVELQACQSGTTFTIRHVVIEAKAPKVEQTTTTTTTATTPTTP